MHPIHAFLWLAFLLGCPLTAVQSRADERAPAADTTGDVAEGSLSLAGPLPAIDGSAVRVIDPALEGLTVVCFLGTECPLAKVYAPRLDAMAKRFAQQGVRFVGINSNPQDSMEELRKYGADHEIGFPLAKDFDQHVAAEFHATRTPEVFVVSSTGHVLYRGRIDDQYQPGAAKASATVHDLQDAIEQVLSGRPVQRPVTTAVGCLIRFPDDHAPNPESGVTYCDQVSRILQQHCVECHRPGEIGPFALTDYDEVVGWSDMIFEVIEEGRMPPWHARTADT
jgi:peroxiredoxin